MNVGELKKLIANIDDNVKVFTVFGDHEAREVGLVAGHISQNEGYECFGEYFGEECLLPGETSIPVLMVE